jgi:hypothetical protein
MEHLQPMHKDIPPKEGDDTSDWKSSGLSSRMLQLTAEHPEMGKTSQTAKLLVVTRMVEC